ncbi:ComEA family DNA-binding protein [Paraherbaspirillum soli]|uniref:ComEA family DNA-binding protein n=1 Tax=Paraherbaspirillum soli TaxID=631222 RepID=A0ABW0M3K3_9BURK
MFKKLLLVFAMLIASMNLAFAQVDVNKADLAALDGIKGIGPATAKRILDERTKGGDFKDWNDFENRVSGIGHKSSIKLSQAGLQVNGKAKENAAPQATPGNENSKSAGKAKAKQTDKSAAKAGVAN